MPDMPPVGYARSGHVNIAYQVTGEGNSIDMVMAPGTVSHLAIQWRSARRAMFDRVSAYCRLIRFDKRGTGMSDRVTDAATLEERADDIRAVMDAAGSERAVIFGLSEGGSMACMFAAAHPERVRSLLTWGCMARFITAPDYPWGTPPEVYEQQLRDLERDWPSRDYVMTWGAGLGRDADPAVVDQILEIFQMAATPSAVLALERMNGALDIRDVLPSIRVPALVMAREGDPLINADAVRDMARRIPNARAVLFPGNSHQIMGAGLDAEPVFSEIERFVLGARQATPAERFLTTVLFLDLVGSTERVAAVGDAAWRSLLDAHYRAMREELARVGGHEVDTAGDGLLATFDGPARAVRFAAAALRADRQLGLAARVGVHCGEVERSGDSVRGIAVHFASRIAAAAAPGEVLVSTTVRDLVAGSGLRFEDRGAHSLKGIPEPRQLLRALE